MVDSKVVELVERMVVVSVAMMVFVSDLMMVYKMVSKWAAASVEK